MFNGNRKKKKSTLDKMTDKLSETLETPLKELSQGKEISELKQVLESYHAHFEKMLEVQAKILNVLENHTKIKGEFNEEYYYKEKGFEKANQNKIQGKTITAEVYRGDN